MKLKRALLGSAAVLLAANGARAADAIVMAEPEPVEYVRVCDAYGAGFFYIPGTETCLSISGYVWFEIQAGSYDEDADVGFAGDTAGYYDDDPGEYFYARGRARLNFDARSDTEWGTLRGFIRVQSTFNAYRSADGNATIDQAIVELGGLRVGYTESAWAQSQGGGASNWGSHSWGGMYYGYQERQLIAYTFRGGNGFFGTVSLEDDGGNGDGYVPDVVAKIGVNQGWGSIWAIGAYDESFDGSAYTIPSAAATAGVNDGGFAAAIGVQINVPNMPGSSLRVIGYWADGDHDYGVGAPSSYDASQFSYVYGSAEWSVLASYRHQFQSTLWASVAVQYFSNLYINGTDVSSDVDAIGAELAVVWFPVTNFEVRVEVNYDDILDSHSSLVDPTGNPDGTTSGFLRFTRYF